MNNLEFNTQKWIEKLNSNDLSEFPPNWAGLKEVQLAHISIMDDLISKEYEPPKYKYKRGIVIGAGGAKFFGCGFNCAYILRKLGCSLPIEFWYLDNHEMDNKMLELCKYYLIRPINATEYCKENKIKLRLLNGWEVKALSSLYSNFEQTLYLDADNIPVKDPTYLFYESQFLKYGSIFWPDLPPSNGNIDEWLPPICWENVGLKWIPEPDFETGQYLIDKNKCYKQLLLTMWMNQHSDWFYKFVYGDKSTFHLAWRKCNTNYAMPFRHAGWKTPCILQYDLHGKLLFQHACQGKDMIFNGINLNNHWNGNLISEAKAERDKFWSGDIYSWNEMNDDEKLIATNYIGKYKYTRHNLDQRVLVLNQLGYISHGADHCEKRWCVRLIDNIPNIIVIGGAHKGSDIAMFFAKDDGSGFKFNGKWCAYEKCDITLERIQQ